MRRPALLITLLALLFLGLAALFAPRHLIPPEITKPLGIGRDISEIRANQTPLLTKALADQGLSFGAPVYIRIFKEEAELELWVASGETYRLFRSYPICNYSGHLGPKLREGDRQSPEGFYRVGLGALNPNSRFHLSFNLGFPNAHDRANARTGSFLMVHGDCLSVGCYAMTDPMIEEIYVLVEAALKAGKETVPVHAFPFRMTPARMEQATGADWFAFWQDLAPAYRAFERSRTVPEIGLSGDRYVVNAAFSD